jgi:hypothetical protein
MTRHSTGPLVDSSLSPSCSCTAVRIDAKRRGFVLRGLNEQSFCEQILENVINPEEVEDIVVLCETTALYRKYSKQTADLVFTKKSWTWPWPVSSSADPRTKTPDPSTALPRISFEVVGVCCGNKLFSFVSGHDFSRAAKGIKGRGFSPCTFVNWQGLKPRIILAEGGTTEVVALIQSQEAYCRNKFVIPTEAYPDFLRTTQRVRPSVKKGA